jgi:hypothetical protein
MKNPWRALLLVSGLASLILLTIMDGESLPVCAAPSDLPLPPGVKAVWDMDKADREKTATRERV